MFPWASHYKLSELPQYDLIKSELLSIGNYAKENKIDLVLCVAAAQRRGMVDPEEMKRNKKDADNIADNFRISVLGQLIESGIQAERLITFGD